MALDESISNDDVEEQLGGLSIVYSKKLTPYMDGVVIDYVKSMLGRRLTIDSPFSGSC